MNQGIVPDAWKNSIVTVVHKKGKRDCVDNYTPISLTCICCKIMESIISDHVMKYFLENKIFSNRQYGFIKNRSAILQFLNATNDWTKFLDDNKQVDIIYTDFEKAFDKVPHKRLLSKLYSYGVNDKLIKWVESFLRDRSQKVKVNLEVSCAKPVLSGIPQGSVLGPLLFVIFINDLPDVCSNLCDAYLFADDAKLYKCITNIRDSEALNQGFINIVKWSENWLMKLNLSKCKVLSLYRSKNSCQALN
jgi:hypothetical protein